MFSLSVTDTDTFLEMPASAQALYFHLGMHGDDDGFVDCPKKIKRNVGAKDDDMACLVAKGYIIPLESGIVVIRDWRINNTLKNDRYHPTIYRTEKALLGVDESGRYSLGTNLVPDCIQSGSSVEPEQRIEKNNGVERAAAPHPPAFTPPTVDEVSAYAEKMNYGISAQKFVSYYKQQGWRFSNGLNMVDWKAAVDNWNETENPKGKKRGGKRPSWVK